jgi:hypothetical protein
MLKIRQHIARSTANDRTPYESLKGKTPDISALIEFDHYSYVKVRLPSGFPNNDWILARWLGPADGIGQGLTYYVIKENGQIIARSTVRPLLPEEWTSEGLTYYVIKENGQIIARSTVRPLLPEEWTSEVEKVARVAFDAKLAESIGQYNGDEVQANQNDEMMEPLGNADDSDLPVSAPAEEATATNDAVAGPDMLVGAETFLPHGD